MVAFFAVAVNGTSGNFIGFGIASTRITEEIMQMKNKLKDDDQMIRKEYKTSIFNEANL